MEKGSTIGLIKEYIQDNGNKINYMVKADMNGQMVNNIKETLEIITKKDKVCSCGRMVKAMMEDGKIINNTERQSSQIRKDRAKLVCGRMEKESNGLIIKIQLMQNEIIYNLLYSSHLLSQKFLIKLLILFSY